MVKFPESLNKSVNKMEENKRLKSFLLWIFNVLKYFSNIFRKIYFVRIVYEWFYNEKLIL